MVVLGGHLALTGLEEDCRAAELEVVGRRKDDARKTGGRDGSESSEKNATQ